MRQKRFAMPVLLFFVAVPALACVSGNGQSVTFASEISLRPENAYAAAAIDEGIPLWSNCSGIPRLSKGSFGDIVIDVFFEPGLSTSSAGGCGEIQRMVNSSGQLVGAKITLYETAANLVSCESFRGSTLAHEVGHALGLANSSCAGYLMGPGSPSRQVQPDECDHANSQMVTSLESPDDPLGSDPEQVPPDPTCEEGCSPILIDTQGDGIAVSDLEQAVLFDIDADGHLERISWPMPLADDMFLVLDRNGDGAIDDGSELFGSSTEQPPTGEPNGFNALGVFDLLSHGGNGDGWVSGLDEIWGSLRVWADWNRNGRSDRGELLKLSQVHLEEISLAVVVSKSRDRHGNEIRWRSLCQLAGRYRLCAADVIFLSQ